MPSLLLTAHDCTGHVHLVVGSNSIASTRCTKSIEYGAKPIVIAPPYAEFHYALRDAIDAGKVEWIRRKFEDADVQSLGRDEVNRVVDAVFVTLGGRDAAGDFPQCPLIQRSVSLGEFSRYSLAYLIPLPPVANPGQRLRRSKSLHLHASVNTLGRSLADRNYHVWERV